MTVVRKNGFWVIERGITRKIYFTFCCDGKPLWSKFVYRAERWSSHTKACEALKELENSK